MYKLDPPWDDDTPVELLAVFDTGKEATKFIIADGRYGQLLNWEHEEGLDKSQTKKTPS